MKYTIDGHSVQLIPENIQDKLYIAHYIRTALWDKELKGGNLELDTEEESHVDIKNVLFANDELELNSIENEIHPQEIKELRIYPHII